MLISALGCSENKTENQTKSENQTNEQTSMKTQARPDIYASVKLTADLTQLSDTEKEVLKLLIMAAQEMDKVFWKQSFPQSTSYGLSSLNDEERKFYQINYGPWDRLNGNLPFINAIGKKPEGAGFYPVDMTK